MPVALALVLASLSAPWWWPLLVALGTDLRVAARGGEPTPIRAARAGARTGLVVTDSRVPLARRLAFHGVERRQRAYRRWTAGFGRRGL